MQLSFLGMEVMSYVLFGVCAWHALKVVRSKQRFLELVMAAIFGVVLEEFNVILSGGFYVYGRDFLVIFDQAPLAIGLGWAVIIYSAMRISDAYGLQEWVKPFFDAIQAILIDLSMDVIAIRLGFWRWPIPLTDGWFGVPAGNFFGWMLVVVIYSGLTRFVRHLVKKNSDNRYLALQVLSPPICYGLLYSLLWVYVTVAYAVFSVEAERFIIFGAELALFAAIVLFSVIRHGVKIQGKIELGMSFVQLTFHAVFLSALMITGIFTQIPAMIPIAVILLVAELALHRIPSELLPKV
jgi:uncharacterized membrane protein